MVKWPVSFICVFCLFCFLQVGSCSAQLEQAPSDCIPLNSVTRVVNIYEDVADTLFYQGQLFTGCTVSPPASNSEVIYQTVRNGIISRQYSYMENGKMGRDFNFRDGKSHGLHAMYFDDGRLYIEEFYENGIPVGTHRRWHGTGNLARVVVYKNGKKQSESLYNPQGIEIETAN